MFFVLHEDSFHGRLVSGTASNMGSVEVKYDDTQYDVCYESKEGDTRSWSFSNVQVMCRELGFPGAMFARKGGEEDKARQSKIYGYKCTEGTIINQSFQHCLSMNVVQICRPGKKGRHTVLTLTAHTWQKCKSRFLTCSCHEIYRKKQLI